MSRMSLSVTRWLAAGLLLLFVCCSVTAGDRDLPASYDLRNVGGNNYVTGVRSQKGGTCWTHGTMASMESNLLMTGAWTTAGETGEPDLSEYHLDWWNGFNQNNNDDIEPPDGAGLEPHQGGDYRVASAYLARAEGAVRGVDADAFYTSPSPRTSSAYHYYFPRDVVWMTVGENLSDIDEIKQAVIDWGAIGTCLCFDYSFMDGDYNHWQPDWVEVDPNHAVTIVGWDDNRVTPAPQPGAWLIKNSWGESWGLGGYFWISYYDKHAGHHPEMGAISFRNVEPLAWEKVFYHDYHGWRDTRADVQKAFNRFITPEGGYLEAVSLYTAEDSATYTVRLYDSYAAGQLQGQRAVLTGMFEGSGFHTLDLPQPVKLQGGEFCIETELSAGGHPFDCTSDVPVLLGAKYRTVVTSSASLGESYYWTGTAWHDLYLDNNTANFCTKAMGDMIVSFDADTTYGWVPLEVKFEAESDWEDPTWVWDFGDGNSGSGDAPTHNYDMQGLYDVTATAVNGVDSIPATRRQFIAVLADTMGSVSVTGQPGDTVTVDIYARNTLPVHAFTVPILYAGDVGLEYLSATTEGCRTEYFEEVEQVGYSSTGKVVVFQLTTSEVGTSPDLDDGAGPILKVRFAIDTLAPSGASTPVSVISLGVFTPMFLTERLDYQPRGLAGEVHCAPGCCVVPGDVNSDGSGPDIDDLIYLVNYMFKEGPVPPCGEHADVDVSGVVDVGDLVHLVNYMFKSGPSPACP